MMTSAVTYSILSRDADELAALVRDRLPSHFTLADVTDDPGRVAAAKLDVLLADPGLAATIIPHSDRLRWCQSTWAGVAPLVKLQKQDYVLTGVKGIFGEQMREYVFAYLLYFSRNIATFNKQKSATPPCWHEAPTERLADKTLGVMGAGSIAQALIAPARAFGMRIIGLRRNNTDLLGFDAMYTRAQKLDFAAHCDVLVNLQPDTPDTARSIDSAFLAALPRGACLINAGRGSALDDDALIAALDQGHLRAAVLDVFRHEPLPASHPFWSHPNIHITSHTAAISRPQDIADIFIRNAKRFTRSEALEHVIDFTLGY
ncbi:D-2-hydroxyacid dehydrogenase [Alteromonas sp. CYL-A6]|uniref:D-2-hydroxyacid dehydrogenase n=1 Tax=Alteromonas nitratireducens TaxID=3390813 RepID=UPI0034BA72E0